VSDSVRRWLLPMLRRGTPLALALAVATGACKSGQAEKEIPKDTASGEASGGLPRVEAGEDGYMPAVVKLGKDRRVIFHRSTDNTCATEVVFPKLGLKKDLPLNKDVEIEIPASAHGELDYECAMAMHKAKLIID
jgi:hypothetical protein